MIAAPNLAAKRLPTWEDLFYAMCWRLSDEHVQVVELKQGMVAEWLDAVGDIDDISEHSPIMGKLLDAIHRDGDKRSDWGRFLALLVWVAIRRKDVGLAWRAGHELLQVKAQADRSARSKGTSRDRLSVWIEAYFLDHRSATTEDVIAALKSAATSRFDDDLADFDEDSGELLYRPHQNSEKLKEIRLDTLEKRIQRTRQTLAG